jgi:hypothetical protein
MFKAFRSIIGALAAATLIGVLAAGVADAAAPQAASLTFQRVASPQDPTFTQLLGINDHGTIAGYYGSGATPANPNRGFTLRLPNTFTSENFPNSAQTQVIAIDNRGDTGGFEVDQAGTTHGFLKRLHGSFQTIDLPGTTFNQLLGLDNQGRAAGYFQDANGVNHAWTRDAHGSFVVPPIANSQATGINDQGVLVGFTQPTATSSSGFILRDNHVQLLNFPGSVFTQALGENDRGQVVGLYNDAAGTPHGFIFQRGAFRTVDVPGATSTVVNGLNNAGRLVGFFTDAQGNTIGFVGTPTG